MAKLTIAFQVVLVGIAGGSLQASILHSPLLSGALLGGGFGLAFSLVFSKRASSVGAGLIWGLGAGKRMRTH